MTEVENKKTHRPLIWICVAYGIGIVMASWINIPVSYLCFLIIGLFLIGVFWEKCWFGSVILLSLFILLGYLHIQTVRVLDKKDISHVARFYRKKKVMLKGRVVSDVQVKDFFKGKKRMFELEIKNIQTQWGWKERTGKILVNLFKSEDVFYGDYILIEGKLHRPYNFSRETNFSYRDYLENKGIRYVLSVSKKSTVEVLGRNRGNKIKAMSFKVRQKLKMILAQNLSHDEAGIMRAILLGDRSHIPKHVRELFVQTGTAHILAISGLHVGVVVALFMMFLRLIPIGRKLQLLGVIVLLIGYAFLTGGRPSVVRASVVVSVFLMSFIMERETDALNTLSLASLIILLYNPLNFFDIGFQLSFVCVLVIILFQPHLRKFFSHPCVPIDQKNALGFYIIQSLSVSLSAWFGAAGLVAYYFNITTPITIVANLIVIPLIAVIVTLGFGILFSGMFASGLSVLPALCLKVVLNIMIGAVFLLAKIPSAYFYFKSVTLWQIAIYYTILLMVFCFLQRRRCVG